MEAAILRVDFMIIQGRRGELEQNKYFLEGKSTLKWPHSKHNVVIPGTIVEDTEGLSTAIDIAPWPLDWQDDKRFILLAGVVLGCAHTLDIPMRWGGDWNQDFKFNERFLDMPHFELLDPRD
jgi:peptidoglycan L-alanyl-D-glutamate endopeptidase CwlK